MSMSLEYKSRNCWELYNSPKDARSMDAMARRYLEFVSNCKTERESIDYAMDRLAHAGYEQNPGSDKFMRPLHGKTLFVARRGKKPLSGGLRLIGAHADTPRLDLKQRPLQEQAGVGQAKTHYYGGIRKYQWFARPLAVHGVIVRKDGGVIKVVLGEDPAEPVFTIADLLPHLAQSQADQPLSKVFEAERMNLVLGHKPLPGKKSAGKNREAEPKEAIKAHMLQLLHDKYGIEEEDLYSAELQAVPAGPARFVGLDSALVGAYGQDDRICVFSALEALLSGGRSAPAHSQCLVLWDKEEIGSVGATGATSLFFEYCIKDLIRSWEPEALFSEIMLNSKGISADVHAAVDPDWQELHEKLNAATIGCGPCFCKFTGSRGKYNANDANAEYVAWLRALLAGENIPWQMAELGKVDGGGGGTVAMYLAAYGMSIIDCGPPILGMHSPFELSSVADIYATSLAYGAFLRS
ncbi:aminopeptidase [Desulfovibrio sp. OttesenSCG-928-G11]|nr:aminopeptidase [Desulfovibrio sp. OttesenSCG-928-G11]